MDIAKKISEVLELPLDVTVSLPKVTLIGKARAHIENCIGLLEYRRELIRLKYKGGIISLSGSGLEIKVMGEENLIILGQIDRIDLI